MKDHFHGCVTTCNNPGCFCCLRSAMFHFCKGLKIIYTRFLKVQAEMMRAVLIDDLTFNIEHWQLNWWDLSIINSKILLILFQYKKILVLASKKIKNSIKLSNTSEYVWMDSLMCYIIHMESLPKLQKVQCRNIILRGVNLLWTTPYCGPPHLKRCDLHISQWNFVH